MKKLCQLVFEKFPEDSRVRRYTNALISKGFKVFVVCIGNKFKKKVETNLTIYYIPIKKKRGSLVSRLFEYLFFGFLSFFVISFISLWYRIKLFHVHTLPDFLIFSCLLPKLLGAKVILDFHELFPEAMMHLSQIEEDSSLIKFLKLQEKVSFMFADEIITIHDPAKEIFQKRLGKNKNIHVIMNGVDITEFPMIDRKVGEKFKIIYHGIINYNVNLSLLIRALSILKYDYKMKYCNIEFHMFGDGPDLNNILSLSNQLKLDNIFYRGRLNYNYMMKELGTANVCILPMKKDLYTDLGYSQKLTEMIYLKIPVISTRLNTYLKYYPANCLLYFNSNDIEDLVKKIIFAYENPHELKKYTENAFNEYQKYNWEIMKKRYLKLLNKCFGARLIIKE